MIHSTGQYLRHWQSLMRLRGMYVLTGMIACLLIALFVRQVLQLPTRSPLLIIASSYDGPWDPNPRQRENVRALRLLDKHNFRVKQVLNVNGLLSGDWADFDETVGQLDFHADPSKPFMLYLNLHGIVDSELNPCFALPGSNPLDPRSWIPLDSIVEHLDQTLRSTRDVVLFLESSRQKSIIPFRDGDDGFETALRKWTQAFQSTGSVRSVHILLAGRSGPRSIDTLGKGADLFTHSLVLGLAGDSDTRVSKKDRLIGDRDRRVSLSELHRFLCEDAHNPINVENGQSIEPELIQTTEQMPILSWATNSTEILKQEIDPLSERQDHTQSLDEVVQIWKSLEDLRNLKVWEDSPIDWAKLKHLAWSIEEMYYSGAVDAEAIESKMDSFRRLAGEIRSGKTERKREVSSPTVKDNVSLDEVIHREEFEAWEKLLADPHYSSVLSIVQSWRESKVFERGVLVPFLFQLSQRPKHPIWTDPETLKRLAEVECRVIEYRNAMERLPLQYLNQSAIQVIERQRRSIEDRLIVYRSVTTISIEIQSLKRGLDEAIAAAMQWSKCHDSIAYAISELLPLGELIDAVEDLEAGPSVNRMSDLYERIIELLILHHKSESEIADRKSTMSGYASLSVSTQNGIAELSKELREELSRRWHRMVSQPHRLSPQQIQSIQQFTYSDFLPTDLRSVEQAIAIRMKSRQIAAERSRSQSKKDDGNTILKAEHALNRSEQRSNIGNRCRKGLMELIERYAAASRIDSKVNAGLKEEGPSRAVFHFYAECDAGTVPFQEPSSQFFARLLSTYTMERELDTVRELAQSESLRCRLLRSATRIIDDYWETPRVGGESYFSFVAEQLVEKAKEIGVVGIHDDLASVSQLIRQRKEIESKGLKVQAWGVSDWEQSHSPEVQCEVDFGASSGLLPGGFAAVYVVSSSGTSGADDLPRVVQDSEIWGAEFLEMGNDKQSQSISIRLNESPGGVLGNEPVLVSAKAGVTPNQFLNHSRSRRPVKVIVEFRGHQYSVPFHLVDATPRASTVQSDKSHGATIRLEDPTPIQKAYTVILDCSASMFEPQSIESRALVEPGAKSLDQSKLQAAKLAVTDILSNWRNSQNWVGFELFGHRVAHGSPEQGILYQDRYYSSYPFSDSLRPFEDVELVLPVGRFSDVEYTQVLQRLDRVLPWGQTPLYLAIWKAIENGRNLGPSIQHDVIVISDGKNYQFNPAPEANIGLEALTQECKTLGVRLHLVGFGVPENELDDAKKQYQTLAEETGGSMTLQVADAVELVRRIESITRVETYTAQRASGESINCEVGREIYFDSPVGHNTPIWIHFRNQSTIVPLNEGTVLSLRVGSGGKVYSDDFIGPGIPHWSGILNASMNPSPFKLGVHPVVRRSNMALEWLLSLQRNDRNVAQRPKHVLIEVRPMDPEVLNRDDKSNQVEISYVVIDGGWKSNAPVPLIGFTTENWPSDKTMAEVRFWCTDQTIPHHSTFTVDCPRDASGFSQKEMSRTSGTVDSLGIEYELHANADQLTLVLNHERASVPVEDVLPIVLDPIRSSKVSRQIRHREKLSIHTFYLDSSGLSNRGLSSVSFQLVSLTEMRKVSLRLVNPIEMKIPSPSVDAGK